MDEDGHHVFPVPPRTSLVRRIRASFGLERVAAVAGIVGAIAAVLALWPVFVPPQQPSPPEPAPKIPDFSTGWIDGDGKSTPYYCDPRKAALERQHPGYDITMTYLPEQHQDNRDSFGIKHDKYMYGCSFSAIKKK